MHSTSLWYETEARKFLIIIFLTNIEILYLECVSTNDYMLILCCLVLFGPTLLFFLFLSLLFLITVSWVRNIPSPTLKGISRSWRRRGRWVREILEASILPADSGILNAPALMKWCTGTCLTCFRRLWWCYQIHNSARWGRDTASHS